MKLRSASVSAVAAALTIAVSIGCAQHWTCDIDAAPDAFAVVVVPGVLITSQVTGAVYPFFGEEWLVSNEPTFEIWSYPTGKATEVRLETDGRLAISVPPGRYCYRASARGFNAAVGRIEVRESAPRRNVEIRLSVAN